MADKRLVHYDLVRIIAIFAVIVVHTSGSLYRVTTPITTFNWQVSNIYSTSGKFSICIFMMVSGMLFLNPIKNISLKALYQKNILRIVTSFIFWSVAYALFGLWVKIQMKGYSSGYMHEFFIDTVTGNYHLWFCYMIIGIYMIVPFIRLISSDENLMKYYLILSVIFVSTIPVLQLLPGLVSQPITIVVTMLRVTFVMGWVGIFILGYYLSYCNVTRKAEIIIYIMGILSLILTIILNGVLSIRYNQPYESLYELTNINILLTAVAVFIFFRLHVSKVDFSERFKKLTILLSECTFGIYFIHVFIIIIFQQYALEKKLYNAVIAVPVLSAGVYIVSGIIIYFFRKIPFARDYLS
jgi:surface polysaccharide O-acyltransferase-like enzyme